MNHNDGTSTNDNDGTSLPVDVRQPDHFEIERLREVLADELDAAIAATVRAANAIGALTSPTAFDPEYAEVGGDVVALCTAAHRDLRAARAHTRLVH